MNKWSIQESLRLVREYDLLEMSIQEIAVAHQRTTNAILHRLQLEGLIDTWSAARGFDSVDFKRSNGLELKGSAQDEDDDDVSCDSSSDYTESDNDEESDDEEEEEFEESFKEGILPWTVETGLREIGDMVRKLLGDSKKGHQGSRSLAY